MRMEKAMPLAASKEDDVNYSNAEKINQNGFFLDLSLKVRAMLIRLTATK